MLDPSRRLLYSAYRWLPVRARVFIAARATPSFRVGAMCIVERADGAILLVRESYRGGWGLPGGLLKRNEEPADAVRREVREEVGLDIELDGEPKVLIEPRWRRVDVAFRARLPAEPAEITPRSQEIVEVRWFPPDELPSHLQPEASRALTETAPAADPTAPAD